MLCEIIDGLTFPPWKNNTLS